MPNTIRDLPGRIECRGGTRKYVERPEHIYEPLKGDGPSGLGERGRQYYGGIKNPKKVASWKPKKAKVKPLDLDNLFKPSGVTSY